MAQITLKGNPFQTNGDLPAAGAAAPAFTLVAADLSEKTLADYRGKKKILTINPSFDTPVCQQGARVFNERAASLDNVVVLAISADLPFAQKRFLSAEGVEVIEVGRPNRQHRRRHGKSDPADAEGAARAVLAGEATAIPKSRDGIVESIRALHVVKRSAIKARTQAANQMTALVLTAPESTRAELRALTPLKRARRAAAWRPGVGHDPVTVTRRAIRALARRSLDLTAEINTHNAELDEMTTAAAPGLVAQQGVSRDVAAKLLIAAGDNPDRLRTEASFAALCGVSPIRASSGKTKRHRLNRSGDRQANNALWTIARVRLSHDPETRAYNGRREQEDLLFSSCIDLG